MRKKILALLMAAAVMAMPVTDVMAAKEPDFVRFKFVSRGGQENWKRVVTEKKADDDQNWFVTFTSMSGSGVVKNRGNARMLVASSRKAGYNKSNSELWPIGRDIPKENGEYKYKYVPYRSWKPVHKNKKCSLFFVGNQNNSKNYSISATGRYTP